MSRPQLVLGLANTRGGRLQLKLPSFDQPLQLAARSARKFALPGTDASLTFDVDASGRPTGLTFRVGGQTAFTASRAK
jgi:hypothetical protein